MFEKYKKMRADVNELYNSGQITGEEYKAEINAIEESYGISLTEWPCDPDTQK